MILWHLGGVPEVDFERLAPGRYEDMVSVLLCRLRQARRVDGSGGDEGRDYYFTDEHGTDAYELKSFTGRMTPARRRHVKQSLTRAMKTRPRSWTLVVPIDPSPEEQRWFDSLSTGLTAQLEWLGKNWLKTQLAQFPEIIRYFSSAEEEVVRILTKISDKNALPDDAAGLAQRFAGQVSRLNEIDPYYWFGFVITPGAVTVTAHPRYPDAPRDRPITVAATLEFNDSPGQQEASEALAGFMKFGTPVTIPADSITSLAVDAPAGLGGEFPGETLTLDGTFPPETSQAAAVLLRVPAQPPVRHTIRLDITERSAGPVGGLRLLARDRSGLLTMDLRFDTAQRTCHAHLDYRYHVGALPQDAVPVLRFCAAVAAGQEMAITDPAGNIIVTSSGPFGPATWPERYIECAETLAKVQQLTGTSFPLPRAFTAEDQRDLHYARAVLGGEDVQAQWSGMIAPLAAPAVDNLLAQIEQHGNPFSFTAATPETLQAAGGRLPLGLVVHIMHSTRIANLDEVRAWRLADTDGSVDVHLEPASNTDMTVRAAAAEAMAREQPLAS
jgi:hypothetical protein